MPSAAHYFVIECKTGKPALRRLGAEGAGLHPSVSLRRRSIVTVLEMPVVEHVPPQGMVAGDEKGLVASFTNMTRALRSPVPLLDTCIGVLAGCPSMD